MALIKTPVVLVALVHSLLALADKTCYYPDKTISPLDVPCNSTAEVSSCCGESALCMDNGACFLDGMLSRGSCTDENWDDDACLPYCQDCNPSGGCVIIGCEYQSTGNQFACGGLDSCSNSSEVVTMAGYGGFVLKADQLASAESAAGVVAATSSGSVASSTLVTTVTATPSGSDTSSTYTAGSVAGAAIGVALPLLIIIGVLSFLLFREKRKIRNPESHRYQPAPTVSSPYKQDAQLAYNSGSQIPMHHTTSNWAPYQTSEPLHQHMQQQHQAPIRELDAAGETQELEAHFKR